MSSTRSPRTSPRRPNALPTPSATELPRSPKRSHRLGHAGATGERHRSEPRAPTPPQRAALFEDYAQTAYQVGHMGAAFTAADRAIALHQARDDHKAVGRCLGKRAHYYWVVGEGNAAWQQARSSIEVLEPHGPSAELATAYNQLTDLAALSGRTDEARLCGDRALRLAGQLGSDIAKWRALVAMGTMRMQHDPDDVHMLHDAIEGARMTRMHDVVVHGLITLTSVNVLWVRPEEARRHARQGIDYAERHQRDALKDYLQVYLVWLGLRGGTWDDAAARIHQLLAQRPSGGMVTDLQAEVILAELCSYVQNTSPVRDCLANPVPVETTLEVI